MSLWHLGAVSFHSRVTEALRKRYICTLLHDLLRSQTFNPIIHKKATTLIIHTNILLFLLLLLPFFLDQSDFHPLRTTC